MTEEAIRGEINQAIVILQGLQCDIFGFGDIIHEYEPELWRLLKDDWSDKGFPVLEHDLQVSVQIQRLGLRSNPLIRNMELNHQDN